MSPRRRRPPWVRGTCPRCGCKLEAGTVDVCSSCRSAYALANVAPVLLIAPIDADEPPLDEMPAPGVSPPDREVPDDQGDQEPIRKAGGVQ